MVHRVIAGAYFDPLTHLFNRRTFLEAVDVGLQRARAAGSSAAVVHLDIDGFSRINQCLGSRIGDLVLVEVAQRLKRALRPTDIVARGGDDEFLVFVDLDDAAAVEPRLAAALDAVRAPLRVDSNELLLAFSAGTAVFPDDADGAEDLIQNAAVALDASRSLETGQLIRFDTGYACRLQESLTLSQRLQRAVIPDEFELVFEPLLDCRSGLVFAAETLLRWRSPDGSRISPAIFIPLAERNGSIVAIGRWVLQEAFATLAEWRRYGRLDLKIAVNVSARQLQEPDFVETVRDAAAAAGVPLDRVILELTETALLADVDAARRALDRLVAAGASLAIDDFGTGNATLATLQDLPVSILKIDRRFVAAAPRDLRSRQIVGACIGIAENLGLMTVAEGIETEAQLALVRQLRCNLAQGYFFTRSLAAEAFSRRYVRPRGAAANPGSGEARGADPGSRRRTNDPAVDLACADGGRS